MSGNIIQTHAERCPVCEGTGIYEYNEYYVTTTVGTRHTCHGCNGTGWVTVPDIITTLSGN